MLIVNLIKRIYRKVKGKLIFCNSKQKEIRTSFKYYLYNYFITYIPFFCVRRLYLTRVLKYSIAPSAFIHLGCFFGGEDISISSDSVIGRDCIIVGEISIGKHNSISAYSIIQSVTHDKNSSIFIGVHKKIVIKDYCWIGFRSIILPGVTLEDGVIIGANSIANKKNYKEYGVYAGCPAIFV